MEFCLMWWLASAGVVRRSSSIPKWAAWISPIYLESPHFTRTSIPTHSAATRDMTSLTACGQNLSIKNRRRKRRLRRLLVEFRENGLSEDHQILQAYREQTAPQSCRTRHHYLLPVCYKVHLNTAQKCVKLVRLAKSRIIRPPFNLKSPTKSYTEIHADLIYGHAGYYVTSYFRSAFIKFRKTNGWKCRLRWLWVKF